VLFFHGRYGALHHSKPRRLRCRRSAVGSVGPVLVRWVGRCWELLSLRLDVLAYGGWSGGGWGGHVSRALKDAGCSVVQRR